MWMPPIRRRHFIRRPEHAITPKSIFSRQIDPVVTELVSWDKNG